MASRILAPPHRMVKYLPNLGAAVRQFRAFSSCKKEQPTQVVIEETDFKGADTVWPDSLGPFGVKDPRFPLPGLVGPTHTTATQPVTESVSLDTLLPELPEQRHRRILEQVENTLEAHEQQYMPDRVPPEEILECVALDCPVLIRKDFATLFPNRNVMAEKDFTIITVSQRTENDMTGWSMDVEEEREELLQSFVEGANEICNVLYNAGYWADFIDPSCGKPYKGPYTCDTLVETDDRYRKLGFEIDDLGCCKVIHHHLWGSHSYVGCVFTNAPLHHPIIQSIWKD